MHVFEIGFQLETSITKDNILRENCLVINHVLTKNRKFLDFSESLS